MFKIKFFLFFYFLIFYFLLSENIPQRIVSLSPVITEEIFILGKGDKIVGNTIYCTRPEEAKYKEKVGNIIDVSVEKIYSLKPDIVFATNLTNQKDLKKLKSLGIKVKVFNYPLNFNQLCNDFINIGGIIDEEKKAKEIVNHVKMKLEIIKNQTKNKRKVKVLIQVGTNPLWVAGTDSFVNDFILFSGGDNVIKGKGGIYSIEEIIKRNPEIIITTAMGINTEEEKKNWSKYKMIDAVKNDKIFIIDSNKLCSPTPNSFLEIVEELYKIFHGELKR